MDDLHWATAVELGRAYRDGSTSPTEVVDHLLGRIAEIDGDLQSFQLVLDTARDDARRATEELRAGDDCGPLHGIPVAVKDLCDVAGAPTLAGLALRRGHVAVGDAPVVARLRAAGAVLLGKLAMTEGAMAGYHPDLPVPVNPWDHSRWAGVSSSGSGAAVAAGLCPIALGSDTGGSIRFPAAACGVVGLKPSYGRVPLRGVFPLATSLDHVGPLARGVDDALLALRAIAGVDPVDPTSRAFEPLAEVGAEIAGLRVGFDETYAAIGADPAVIAGVSSTLDVLREAGAVVRPVSLPDYDETLWVSLAATEAALTHVDTFPSRAAEYGPYFRAFLGLGHTISGLSYAGAIAARRSYRHALARVFEDVDLVAMPTMGSVAFDAPRTALRGTIEDISELSDTIGTRFTGPWDLSGDPALALPCGIDDATGMPLSVQLAAPAGREARLVAAGRAIELRTDWHRRHPV